MLSYMHSLYIFNINILSAVSEDVNILSQSVGGLFCFVDTFLCCAKYVQFDLVPFVYFCFCFTCLRRHIPEKKNKTKLKFKTKRILPRFLTISFMLSGLKFLLHFEFIFVHGEREQSSLIIQNVAVHFFLRHLQKTLSFPYSIFLFPLLQI